MCPAAEVTIVGNLRTAALGAWCHQIQQDLKFTRKVAFNFFFVSKYLACVFLLVYVLVAFEISLEVNFEL